MTLEADPILQRFLESGHGKEILGPEILGQSTTLMAMDTEQGYYLFERSTPTTTKILNLLLNPDGTPHAYRTRSYIINNNPPLHSIMLSIYSNPDLKTSVCWSVPDFKSSKHQPSFLIFFLQGIAAGYNSRGLKIVTDEKHYLEQYTEYTILDDGTYAGRINPPTLDRISVSLTRKRSCWRLTETSHRRGKRIITVPARVNTKVWLEHMNVEDLSWTELGSAIPIELQVFHPLSSKNNLGVN